MSLKRIALLIALIVLVTSLSYLPVATWVSSLVEWGQIHPAAGPLVYVVFVTIATVLFLPGPVASMIGGFLFGVSSGLLFAAIAIPLGAQSAFECGRWVLRG